MVYFNPESAPAEWYCQLHNGCILFALMNGGYVQPWAAPNLFKWLPPNENMKEKPLEEQVLFELKVMAIWALITGYYPFDHKETFYTIYSAFMKLRSNKGKILETDYKKKVLHYAQKLKRLGDFFANHDGKSLNDGTWDAGKRLRLQAEDFSTLDSLPFKSLLCIENRHWVVYMGALDEETTVVLDSKKVDGYMKVPVSALTGQKIIKPKSIKVDACEIDRLLMDFYPNHRAMLENLRRREFSFKMAEIFKRLDYISFTEHDYNALIKKGKSLLKRLDEEHFRDEC